MALALPVGTQLLDGARLAGMAGRAETPEPMNATATRAQRTLARDGMQLSRAESTRRSDRQRGTRRGTAEIQGDGRGHFRTNARINRREIEVLVDTGASSVAMSKSTAARLGVRVRRKDFVHSASTANGRVAMALATLDRVRIDGIELRDVEAAILPDGALDGVLLGMSFLGRLEGFRVENGRLVMQQ